MNDPADGATLGRYRIQRQLGAGGMGAVYAATDTRLNREVALKLVNARLADDTEFIARFRREANVLARLDSPHIVTIYEHGIVDGTQFIATQLVSGGDLDACLRSRGSLSPAASMRLMAQIADALEVAHGAGVVHRDVKPHNILVRDPAAASLHVYLCDFGIASGQGTTRLTRTGTLMGTFAFTAPELAQGEEASPASDLYSLGCVLWACMTGRAPYVGTEADVLLAHLDSPVPQLPGSDPETDRANEVLRLSMAKDPADRYQSAAHMRAALLGEDVAGPLLGRSATRVARRHLPAGRRATIEAPASRPPRRRGAIMVASVAALVLAGGGVAWWSQRDAGTDSSGPPPSSYAAGGAGVPDRAIRADFDGDRKGDLIAFAARGDDLDVVDWSSTGTAFSNPTTTPWQPAGEGWGDRDGDGILDRTAFRVRRSTGELVATTTLSADDSVHNEPLGNRLDQGFPQYVRTASGDFTGDGDEDLAYMYQDSDHTWIYVMVNKVTLLESGHVWVIPENAPLASSSIHADDLDGDGVDDLALVAPTGTTRDGQDVKGVQPLVTRGTSFDGLEPREPLPPRVSGAGMLVADVIGDADLEAVTVYRPNTQGRVRIEFRDSPVTKKASRAQSLRPLGPRTSAVTQALSDVNGDGRADLVLIPMPKRRQSVPISVFLSDGDRFTDPVSWGEHATSLTDWTDLAPTEY